MRPTGCARPPSRAGSDEPYPTGTGGAARGDAPLAQLAAERRHEAEEPEARQRGLAVGPLRQPARTEHVEVADEPLEAGPVARRGDHDVGRDAASVGEQD